MTSSSWKNLFLCIVGLEGCCVQQRCARTCVPKCFCDSNLFCFSNFFRKYFCKSPTPNAKMPIVQKKVFSNTRGKLWAIKWSSKCEAVRNASLLHGLEGRCVQLWCVRTCFDLRTWFSCIFLLKSCPKPENAHCAEKKFFPMSGLSYERATGVVSSSKCVAVRNVSLFHTPSPLNSMRLRQKGRKHKGSFYMTTLFGNLALSWGSSQWESMTWLRILRHGCLVQKCKHLVAISGSG